MNDDLRQRDPRIRDEAHLAYIREQPCCICGDPFTVAHHPRIATVNGRSPGLAEKASDKWALPLCDPHHRELHTMNENYFWSCYGIDPLARAMQYRRRP